MKIKNKFILNKSNLNYLLNNYIKPLYSDVNYKIDLSNTTKSIYITLIREDTLVGLRLSDHLTNKQTNINNRTYIIKESTSNLDIVNIIQKRIKELNIKRVHYLMEKLSL